MVSIQVCPPSWMVEEVFEMFVIEAVVGGYVVWVPLLVVPGLAMLL